MTTEPTPSPLGPTKPLYLTAIEGMVMRRQGPALRIDAPGRAPWLLPLARLNRVVVCHGVAAPWPLLHSCLEARLPILFLDPDKRPKGWLVPHYGRPIALDLAGRLNRVHRHPAFADGWLNLRRHLRHRHARTALRRLGHPTDDSRLLLSDAGLHVALQARPDAPPLEEIYPQVRLWLLARLRDHGLVARWLGADPSCPDIARDLSEALAPVVVSSLPAASPRPSPRASSGASPTLSHDLLSVAALLTVAEPWLDRALSTAIRRLHCLIDDLEQDAQGLVPTGRALVLTAPGPPPKQRQRS